MAASSQKNFEVSRRYAKALFQLAQEQNAMTTIEKDVEYLRHLYAAHPELNRLFPLTVAEKEATSYGLAQLLPTLEVSELMKQFLTLVMKNQRIKLIPIMLQSVKNMITTARGELTLEVITAMNQQETFQRQFQEKLSKALKREINIEWVTDPTIIGGIVIRHASFMIDSSVNTQLENIYNQTSKAMILL